MRARLLLAAIVLPSFTLSAQQQGHVALSRATTTLRTDSARLDQEHSRSASVDDERLPITPGNRGRVRMLERLRSAAFLVSLEGDSRVAEDMTLLVGGASAYPMPWGVARVMYAELGEKVSPARQVIDAEPVLPPTITRGSGCWWLWAFIGIPVCW